MIKHPPSNHLKTSLHGVFLLTLSLSIFSVYAIDPKAFADKDMAELYTTLIAELRCLVCQNQNLADSNAPLAADLRDEVGKMVRAGKSGEEIKRFLVDRYGDFVLYRPPFQQNTLALWLGPLLFMLLGLVMAVRYMRKKRVALGSGQPEEYAIPKDEDAP